ncbi:MAG: hypothetical protein ABSF82_13865 [Candidatus Bathyarchaeia archaeon]
MNILGHVPEAAITGYLTYGKAVEKVFEGYLRGKRHVSLETENYEYRWVQVAGLQ